MTVSRREALKATGRAVAAVGAVAILPSAALAETTDPHLAWWEEWHLAYPKYAAAEDRADEFEASLPLEIRRPRVQYSTLDPNPDGSGGTPLYAYSEEEITNILEPTVRMSMGGEKGRKNRIAWRDAIIKKFHHLEAASKAQKDASGYTKLRQRADKLREERYALEEKICSTPARTIPGLVVLSNFVQIDFFLGIRSDDGQDLGLARNLGASLRAMAGKQGEALAPRKDTPFIGGGVT